MSKRPWKPELVFLFCGAQLFSVFCGVIVTSLLHKFGVNGFKDEDSFGNILIATLSFQGVTWILIPIFLRFHGMKMRDFFGLRKKRFFHSIGLAIATLIVVLIVAFALEHFSEIIFEKLHWHPKQEPAVELLTSAPWWPTGIYLAFFAVVIAPVAEEFIFRGVLYSFGKELGYPKLSLIGVSILFALIHGAPAIFLPLFILALALTWLYEEIGNLFASITVHSLFNAANLVLFYFAQKYAAS